MALGAVQSGYASTTYAYRQTTTMAEEFYSAISSAAQMTEEKNDSHIIGLAMIPYGNTNVSYGMKAQYAPESTEDNPVIQVTSNYGGETVSYKVNINEVDTRNASQLEMFALLSYTDDQGISDGGSFGSYHKMKVYADNAKINGYWEGNEDWDSFLNARHDWAALIVKMAEDYSKAGIYSQFLDGQKLINVCNRFTTLPIDFGKSDESKETANKKDASDDVQRRDILKEESAKEASVDAKRQDAVEEEEGKRDWLKYIREKLEELRVLIISGKGEQSYQIGNSSFTLKEWRKFLASFDSMEDAARELMRREQEAEEEKEEEE
ncbi:MAG: hypothetical protein NC094_13170 [Bacteroidales bacterium]|nr:hypothetical protein [Lachnoclostridium sp.]MCM1385452.1 hypothetical protein [Lachnoclostridium sp.]MCM1466357.1 hypothetical protein [Bacteroidales bacterium]